MKKKLKNIFEIKNKVVVITGAAGLLGKMHAEAVAAYGGIPILIDINSKKIKLLEKQIRIKFNCQCKSYKIDITKENQIKKNSNDIFLKFGKIDALINNASSNPTKFIEKKQKNKKIKKVEKSRLENFSLKMWQEDINVGLTGSFLCSKYYGQKIASNKNGGTIINISSDLAVISPDQRLYKKKNLPENKQPVKPISYSVVKTGIIGLTKYLSTYWIEKKVRCNAICPGGINNNFETTFVKKVEDKIPLGRMAYPDEYQGTLIWMLSDASSYLNGSAVIVDGGRSAW